MNIPPRAVIYARYSSDLQRDASIEDQIRLCREYAHRQGIEIVGTYSDRATSGASLMRPGIQSLIRDAQNGMFNLVISEALDRLSRNQADIASLYQRFQFLGCMIETTSEGAISEMQIGFKGTMNALFLKDLAAKTRRGLKGRAMAGKNTGGKTYGYDNIIKYDETGEPIRGDRKINPIQAAIVRRIFKDYAAGISPRKIAEDLNKERVPGPTGRAWGQSTIHGNRERGTGILNNELYIGRQIWNRLTYVKDPDTGKRVSRLNPESEWTITDVPNLRILDDDIWNAARFRQGALKTKDTDVPVWDRRRPKTLFSGLMTCGCCGGGFSKVSQTQFGCSTAHNKGPALCTNRLTISQSALEALILSALAENLVSEEALGQLCEDYTRERNRIREEASQNRSTLEKELATVIRDHAKLVEAIIAGVPAEQIKDRMIGLDDRRKELERTLSATPAPDPIRFHPNMAATFKLRVKALIAQLGRSGDALEAKEALRSLVERITLTPDQETGKLSVHLEGGLAALLQLSMGQTPTAPLAGFQGTDIFEEFVLVAGVGFEPTTFRL